MRNKIDTIQDSEGNWISDYEELKTCFTEHFTKMSTKETPTINSEIINLIPTTITNTDNTNLNRPPDSSEIKVILFSMAKDKAPGPDGFPPNFFQANWDIVGDDIISDNIVIAHELIHSMRSKRGVKVEKGSMEIKIDMEKAFDIVDWNFLDIIMSKMGFNTSWCQNIMQCISTTTSVVLINGSPHYFFTPSRILRQGDPLSPYLFLLCMEALSRTLIDAEDIGIITGINI
ncbi:uncharacterized protein LOC113334602 [Papaver somniferum]|uniref:uncharacterized protein LOC113334602 n=1 Tax=Papaver somniferum TaxID=3469 RepID=UPI000E6F6109|nr:uncharacterized protein LOC113334602 [Papaver somniferum]